MPWGTTLIFILSRPSPSVIEMLVNLKENGHRLMVLQVGDLSGSEIENEIAWYNIRHPGDLMRVTSEGAR